MEPLEERLRPATLEDFLGNPVEAAALENRTGAILVHGPIGCGKTSLALVLGSMILGKQLPHLSYEWNHRDGRTLFGRHFNAFDFDEKLFKDSNSIADRAVFIVDEAHDLDAKKISYLRGLVERDARRSTYIFVTSEEGQFSKDKGALRSRCYPILMEPLEKEDRAVLTQRGWTAMSKPGAVPADLLEAFEKFDVSHPLKSGRNILRVVEKYALIVDKYPGKAAERAIMQCRF